MKDLFNNVGIRWASLLTISAAFSALLQLAHLPAALMFGPLIAAVIIENFGKNPHIPKVCHAFSQAIIGCLIARAMTPSIMANIGNQWMFFIAVSIATVSTACFIGWILSKCKVIPGTTAIWGLLPGAASAMMILAEEFGADARLVAFMQYLRVVIVGLTASLVACWSQAKLTSLPSSLPITESFHLAEFCVVIAIALMGTFIGPKSKIPAGTLVIPLVIGSLLQANNIMNIELPQWLLTCGYSLLGWNIGMRFTRPSLLHAFSILPQSLGSIFVMIVSGGLLAYSLVRWGKIDPLTAYLATSPGGMDAIAIIATTVKVDVPFIMSMQLARFLMVLLVGPAISKLVAHALPNEASTDNNLSVTQGLLLIEQMKEDEGDID